MIVSSRCQWNLLAGLRPDSLALACLGVLMGCQPASLQVETGKSDGKSDADTGPDIAGDSGAPGAATTCGLTTDLSAPWLWEGDTASFALSCTSSLDASAVTVSLLQGPDGAVFDAEDWTLVWDTGPADGGRVDLVFSAQISGSGQVPEAHTVSLWVADNPALPDAQPVEPTTYTEEWGLPVVHLLTTGTLSESEQAGVVVWQGESLDAQLKIRGASSASYPKPSYTLDFDSEEIALPMWGASRDHLVLLTTFDDNSYVRQKLIYDQWAAIAATADGDRLTPRTAFVVVYINREYHGLYVALDRIDNEFVRHMGLDDTGDLYKSVNHDANFYLTRSSGGPKSTLHDGYEKKEGEPEDDFSSLDALVGFTGEAADAEALVEGAAVWFEPEEFMDWFLLVYCSLSEDSAGKNAYLYQDPQTDRFHYVPWDFNHSWGQNWYTARTDVGSLNSYSTTNRIFWAIQNDPAAAAQLWSRLDQLREDNGPLSLAWQRETLDDYYRQIQPSAERDWALWADEYYAYSRWSSYRSGQADWQDFEGEKAYLMQWLTDRAAVLENAHPPQ